jgi:hypothetical protein
MNICAGDGWDKLCPFLGKTAPNAPFPCTNQTDYANFDEG